jgi:hypothetical protein
MMVSSRTARVSFESLSLFNAELCLFNDLPTTTLPPFVYFHCAGAGLNKSLFLPISVPLYLQPLCCFFPFLVVKTRPTRPFPLFCLGIFFSRLARRLGAPLSVATVKLREVSFFSGSIFVFLAARGGGALSGVQSSASDRHESVCVVGGSLLWIDGLRSHNLCMSCGLD